MSETLIIFLQLGAAILIAWLGLYLIQTAATSREALLRQASTSKRPATLTQARPSRATSATSVTSATRLLHSYDD